MAGLPQDSLGERHPALEVEGIAQRRFRDVLIEDSGLELIENDLGLIERLVVAVEGGEDDRHKNRQLGGLGLGGEPVA